MLVVALTGGIGSGKSVVAHHLEALGVPIIDADVIARNIVKPGSPALVEIEQAFGTHLVNAEGALDRAALRRIVFAHSSQRKRLEKILHPRILQIMTSWLETQTAPYVVLVIPLLFESGQMYLADRILVVDCDEALQIKRVVERDGQTTEQVQQVLASQVDRKTRLNGANDIIENNGNLDQLIEATDRLHNYYLDLAAHT